MKNIVLIISVVFSLAFSGYVLYNSENNEKVIKIEIHDEDNVIPFSKKSSSFNKMLSGSSEAVAATYVNQANHIQAAATLYNVVEEKVVSSIDDLIGIYINDRVVPARNKNSSSWEINKAEKVIFIDQTLLINEKLDFTIKMCEGINDNGGDLVHCVKRKEDLNETISAMDKELRIEDQVTIFMKL